MDSSAFDRRLSRIRETFSTYRLFFVVGAPKSGTTWLQKALDAHPQIVCAGEGHFVDTFIQGIRRPMGQYFSRQEVVTRNVYEGNPYYRYAPTEELEFLATVFIVNAFAGLEIPRGTMVIGDKTPANVEHLDLLHHLFPNAKFVNIVRDGRDALVSTFKHVERISRTDGTPPRNLEKSLLDKTDYYSARWVRAVSNAQGFAMKHPDMLHTVRYEDLKGDFAGAFSRVLGFLGVDCGCEAIEKCESEASFRRLSGGREAGDENVSAFFRKGVVGDWRSGLGPQHLEIFNRVGAQWLERLGYELEPSPAAVAAPK